jgi:hypothetical protein
MGKIRDWNARPLDIGVYTQGALHIHTHANLNHESKHIALFRCVLFQLAFKHGPLLLKLPELCLVILPHSGPTLAKSDVSLTPVRKFWYVY